MTLSRWVRQFHRWTSMAFVAGVVVYMVAMQQGQPPAWMGLLALAPLVLLLLSGLYLFVLPYAAGWRNARRA